MPKTLVLMLSPITGQWQGNIRSNGNAWRIEQGHGCLEMSFRNHYYEYLEGGLASALLWFYSLLT